MSLNPKTGVLRRRGTFRHKNVERGLPCEDGARCLSNVCTSQGMSRIANNPQKIQEKHGTDSPSHIPVVSHAADILVLYLYPPEL